MNVFRKELVALSAKYVDMPAELVAAELAALAWRVRAEADGERTDVNLCVSWGVKKVLTVMRDDDRAVTPLTEQEFRRMFSTEEQ